MSLTSRRNLVLLTVALSSALAGYGVAAVHLKRSEVVDRAMTATAELWYFYELLRTVQVGDTKHALPTMATRADLFVSTVSEADDGLLNEEQREFRAKVLKAYRTFRDAHPEYYVAAPQMPAQEREELLRMQRKVSEFLKRATN